LIRARSGPAAYRQRLVRAPPTDTTGPVGPPYNVDIVRFASDGGGTTYAVPASQSGRVLRLRDVAEIGGRHAG